MTMTTNKNAWIEQVVAGFPLADKYWEVIAGIENSVHIFDNTYSTTHYLSDLKDYVALRTWLHNEEVKRAAEYLNMWANRCVVFSRDTYRYCVVVEGEIERRHLLQIVNELHKEEVEGEKSDLLTTTDFLSRK